MATTQNTFTGNGSNLGPFSFTFKWLESTDIKVSVGGVLKTAGTHYNLQSLNYTTKTGGQVLFTAGNAPANGASIRIFRDTDDDALSAVFSSGSAIRAKDLNDNFTQNLYVTQEINNNAVSIDGSNPMVSDFNMGGYKITNLAAPVAGTDAANRSFVEGVFSSEVPVFYRRWSKTAVGGETSLSGNDNSGIALSYVPGSEKVFINGALQIRGVDYLGTTGSTLTGIPALTAGDIIEVHSSSSYTVGTVPDGSVTNAKVDGAAAIQSTKLAFIQAGTGATTRTVESKLRDVVSVKDFGAVGNGIVDDTTAIQTALNSGKRYIFVPEGNFLITSLTLPDGVCLIGSASYNSVLTCTSVTATAITTGISNEIRNLKILSSVTKTAGFFINILGNGVLIDSCEIRNYFIGVSCGVVGGVLPVNPRIINCTFSTSNTTSGGGAIQFLNFTNAVVSSCVITGTTVSTTQPTFGVRFQNGDTAFVSNSNITVHGKALLVDPASGSNCYALNVSSSYFDSAHQISGGTTISNAEIIPAGGGAWNTLFTNCWFGLASTKNGCLISPSGGGTVDGIVFSGCEFTDNGESGLLVVGANAKNWIVTGGHSGGNGAAGIRAASATTNFSIVGHLAGNVSGRGPNNIGISLDAAAEDNYIIASNILVGNTTSALIDSSTGTNGQIYNNVGFNGVANVAGLTVGASPWSYTAGHTPETLYFAGGTVSEIRVDGQIVQNTTGATIALNPNQTMSVTYSSVPTIMRKRN